MRLGGAGRTRESTQKRRKHPLSHSINAQVKAPVAAGLVPRVPVDIVRRRPASRRKRLVALDIFGKDSPALKKYTVDCTLKRWLSTLFGFHAAPARRTCLGDKDQIR